MFITNRKCSVGSWACLAGFPGALAWGVAYEMSTADKSASWLVGGKTGCPGDLMLVFEYRKVLWSDMVAGSGSERFAHRVWEGAFAQDILDDLVGILSNDDRIGIWVLAWADASSCCLCFFIYPRVGRFVR